LQIMQQIPLNNQELKYHFQYHVFIKQNHFTTTHNQFMKLII
jgi:hypothetical protein